VSPAAEPEIVESLLEQHLEIETPERVNIRYDLAGIGSRFAAGTIDVAVLAFIYVVVMFVGVLVLEGALSAITRDPLIGGLALGGLGIAVIWAYYLLFELLWDGQTPGKRLLRLRVVSERGGPASPSALILRNILRIADGVPLIFVEVLGGIVMFLNGRSKRIGDFAAGTVVVQEREVALSLERLAGSGGLRVQVEGELTGEELSRVKRFLSRRKELRPDRRAPLAEEIVAPIGERLDLPPGDAETLLVLLASGKSLAEIRDLAGPALDDAPGHATAPPPEAPPE
jgi:uncharacterized RDD family membrane protein YckC